MTASAKKKEAKQTCETMLKLYTDSTHIIFTPRCNFAIKIALLIAKKLKREHALIQEEGGWMTYEKYSKQANLEPIRLTTIDGIINEKELAYFAQDSVLLINSLAAYCASHDMDSISTECIVNDILLINDVSGSIGSQECKQGDMIVGSFGKAKPVPLGKGGFFATNNSEFAKLFIKCAKEEDKDFQEEELDFVTLQKHLEKLPQRIKFLQQRCEGIKKDLKDLDIVHEKKQGLNTIIRFSNDDEKQRIINYCKHNNLEYTVCPREIRILKEAISIEVKRLEE
ncbi:MAG: DegT/DnrJ/EryC1/StrS family aminotransferase [Candidatus Nanoarchaeia archaeon]